MTTRPDVDKLQRLRLDLTERRAALNGLTQNYQAAREHIGQLIGSFAVSRAAAVHWHPGDDPAVYLTLSAGQQAQHPDEVRAAREVSRAREAAQAIQARIEALRPAVDALTQLVKACDQYVGA